MAFRKLRRIIGDHSFALAHRCRGLVSADEVAARQRFKTKAEELFGNEAPFKEPYPELNPLYTMELENGYATHQGFHIARDSRLVIELSRYLQAPIETNRLLRSFRPFHRLKRIDGPVLSLATPCQYNYYHWMLESLPKLALFQRHGATIQGTPIYAECSKAFQNDSLDLLGIAANARIDSRVHQSLQARSLWAATIPGPSGTAHPWAVRWLRQSFFDALPPPAEPIGCVVVSRRQARNRKIVNEDELLDALALLSPTCVALEELSLVQQIDLFRRARIIVAPHGAGLTNLAFARPDALVVELFGATYRNPCFEHLARVVGCRYLATVNDDDRDASTGELNIRVRVADLAAAVGLS